MPALNFKERFAELVEAGVKRQTVRPKRENPIKVGDTLHLYTGMRTRKCRRLMTAKCTEVHDIEIAETLLMINGNRRHNIAEIVLMLNGNRRHNVIMTIFAQLDGFLTWNELTDFFKNQYGLPFQGVLIKWVRV